MIIWIDDAIFAGKVAQIDCLMLLRQAAMRRHTVYISADPLQCLPLQTSPCFLNWLERLSDELKTEVGLLRQRFALASANTVVRANMQRILVSEQKREIAHKCCQINVSTALYTLAQPLHILVENQINDAAFLRAVMPPDWRRKILQWEAQGLLRFVQGGGIIEIRKFIERYSVDQHAIQEYGYPAAVWWYLHFVIYDHDGENAETPSSDSTNVTNALNNAQQIKRSHQLNRRSQEHYLPKPAMLALLQSIAAKFSDIDLQEKQNLIEAFFSDSSRHFKEKTPKLSARLDKNYFSAIIEHQVPMQDTWFDQDGSEPEMRLLAEAIAAAL